MLRSSLHGMLSPIAESPLKESAAERGEDYDEEEESTLDETSSDDEEQLLAADQLRFGRFEMMPVRVKGWRYAGMDSFVRAGQARGPVAVHDVCPRP